MTKFEDGPSPKAFTAGETETGQKRIWGFSYVFGSPLILGALYMMLQTWMSALARSSPAPEQGAMLIAFLILVVGGIVSLVFFVRGLILIVSSLT